MPTSFRELETQGEIQNGSLESVGKGASWYQELWDQVPKTWYLLRMQDRNSTNELSLKAKGLCLVSFKHAQTVFHAHLAKNPVHVVLDRLFR